MTSMSQRRAVRNGASDLALLEEALDNWSSTSHRKEIQVCVLHVPHQQASMQQQADMRFCDSITDPPTASTPSIHQVRRFVPRHEKSGRAGWRYLQPADHQAQWTVKSGITANCSLGQGFEPCRSTVTELLRTGLFPIHNSTCRPADPDGVLAERWMVSQPDQAVVLERILDKQKI